MIYSNLLKSTALIAGLASSVNAITHFKTGQTTNLVKRATELGNSGIYYDIVEDGLSTDVSFSIDYDDVIVIKGYVVSSSFDITASDNGFSVKANYDNTTQFCEDADKWMMVYTYDGSTPALIAPDCDNYFTLLDKNTNEAIDWKAGGCISIGSLAAANPACAASSSATSTAVTTGATTAEPTTYTEIVITETVSGTSTEYTTYCPLTSGKPDYSALSTSVETVSNGVTTTVVVPCSKCAEAASSAVSASSAHAATATTTGSGSDSGLYVETTYVSGTVTVTSYVPCPTEAGVTGATTTVPATGAATGATTAPATGAATETGATGAETETATGATGSAAEGESTTYSTLYTTYATTNANGESSLVTSATGTSTVAAGTGAAAGSSSSSPAGSAATGSASASALEGGASIKLASSGLIAAAVAVFLM